MRALTDCTLWAHGPPASPSSTRSVMRPSRPTTRPTRGSSLAMRAFDAMRSLKAAATWPSTPARRVGRRTEKSPDRARLEGVEQVAHGRVVTAAAVGGAVPLRAPPFFDVAATVRFLAAPAFFAACARVPMVLAMRRPSLRAARPPTGGASGWHSGPEGCYSGFATIRKRRAAVGVGLPRPDQPERSRRRAGRARASSPSADHRRHHAEEHVQHPPSPLGRCRRAESTVPVMSVLPAVDLLARTWDSVDAAPAPSSPRRSGRRPPTARAGRCRTTSATSSTTSPAPSAGPDPTTRWATSPTSRTPWARSNEIGVDWRRQFSGAEVLAEFREVMAAPARAARRAHRRRPGTGGRRRPSGPGTLADMLQLRLMDTWSHEQDIRRAVGRPGHVDGPAADGAVAYFTKLLPYVVGKKAGAPDGATVVFEVDDRVIPIEVAGGRAHAVELAPKTATVRLTHGHRHLRRPRRRPHHVHRRRHPRPATPTSAERVATNMGVMP